MKKCPNCGRILHDDSIFLLWMHERNKQEARNSSRYPQKVFLKQNNHTNNRCGISIRNCFRGVYL